MAGSYNHLINGGIGCAAENLGDAVETIEELFYLVNVFASSDQIKLALSEFYRFERGEADPTTEGSEFALAYLTTQRVLAQSGDDEQE